MTVPRSWEVQRPREGRRRDESAIGSIDAMGRMRYPTAVGRREVPLVIDLERSHSCADPGDRHVLVGRGRDYNDVPPLRGVYAGTVTSDLHVTVTITREA